jgi:zinc transport system substrate-binding protein
MSKSGRNLMLGGAALAALTWTACHGPPAAGEGKPVIAVSIFPVASVVQQLTAPWADVVTLLPPGMSPHHADFTADQMRQLNRADILVCVGLELDPWAEKAAQAVDSKRLVVLRFSELIGRPDRADTAAQEGLDDRAYSDRPPNNHLWLDPILTIQFVEALRDQLKSAYPQHADAIQSAAAALLKDLKDLDREYREQLAALPERRLITFHNAFDLIAERYHLEIVLRLTEIELTPGGEVTPDKYRAAIEAVKKYQLKVLYAEPEFPDQVVQALRRETGVELLQLDPQGNPAVDGYRTYQEMMRSNLKTLLKGQSL